LTDLLIVADYSEFAGQLFTSGRILQYKVIIMLIPSIL
jgi:hypothetical protein